MCDRGHPTLPGSQGGLDGHCESSRRHLGTWGEGGTSRRRRVPLGCRSRATEAKVLKYTHTHTHTHPNNLRTERGTR